MAKKRYRLLQEKERQRKIEMEKQAAIQRKTETKILDQVKTAFDNSTAPPKDTLSSAKEIKNPSQPISTEKIQKKNTTAKIGRNSPCACGSGKKYKKCCDKNNSENQIT